MRGLNIHKNIPVSVTKLTLSLRVGFIGSHLTADKLFPVNPRVITGPPKISLLLEAKSTPALIIKPYTTLNPALHTDPALPMNHALPKRPTLHSNPALPTNHSLPMNPALPTNRALPTSPALPPNHVLTEWLHRQGGSRAEVALIYTMHEALRGYCP